MKKLVKIFNYVIFPLTIVIGLLLLGAGLAPAISPKVSTWLGLLGLSFPVLFLFNVLFLIYWIIQFKWKTLIPLAFFMLNLGQMGLYLQYNPKDDFDQTPNCKPLKVVSYNAHLFGAFSDNWQQDSVIRCIQRSQASIVCLQEVYAKNETLRNLLHRMKKECGFSYGVFYKLKSNRPYGMMVLSQFPIKSWKKIPLGTYTGNMAMWVDIKLNDGSVVSENEETLNDSKIYNERTVRIFNVHLQSFRFNKNDYKAIEDAKNNQLDKDQRDGLISRMRLAYDKRSAQTEILSTELNRCTIPKMVMGDFNDVPVSYTYRQISKGLKDAFVESGNGLETTYKGPFPSFRIDYMLYSDPLHCLTYKSIKSVPGDHKWLETTYNIDDLFY